MTVEQVTWLLVHICGFLFDLLVGFGLFFDRSRPIAVFFCASFHLMNSQLFSIGKDLFLLSYFFNLLSISGMFPYTMLATIPIFFHNDWPRRFFERILPKWFYKDRPIQYSTSCLYSKEDIKPEESKSKATPAVSVKNAPTKATTRHKLFTLFAILYLAEQSFLPYSHFITQGYNNWTNVSVINKSTMFEKISLGSVWLFMGYDDSFMAYVRSIMFLSNSHRFIRILVNM